jgi:hypothetical protein
MAIFKRAGAKLKLELSRKNVGHFNPLGALLKAQKHTVSKLWQGTKYIYIFI